MARYDFTAQLPGAAFQSDGCSGGLSEWWKRLFHSETPIEPCCFDHDVEYHFGSGPDASAWENFRERTGADWRFFVCSLRRPGLTAKLLAPVVFIAVRIGGGRYWHRSYSWGFGWKVEGLRKG